MQQFCWGQVKTKISVKPPDREFEEAVGFKSLDFKEEIQVKN